MKFFSCVNFCGASRLQVDNNPEQKKLSIITLTYAIYDEKGNIRWSDPYVHDMLLAHGNQSKSIENYLFLRDFSEMERVFAEKGESAQEELEKLAEKFYQIYFCSDTYSVYTLDRAIEIKVDANLNVSAEIRKKVEALDSRIKNSRSAKKNTHHEGGEIGERRKNSDSVENTKITIVQEIMSVYGEVARAIFDLMRIFLPSLPNSKYGPTHQNSTEIPELDEKGSRIQYARLIK